MLVRKKSDNVIAKRWYFGDEPLVGMIPYPIRLVNEFPDYEGYYYISTRMGNVQVKDGDYVVYEDFWATVHPKERFNELFEVVL